MKCITGRDPKSEDTGKSDATYDELADCVAEVLVKKVGKRLFEPLTLQFVPWDVNSMCIFTVMLLSTLCGVRVFIYHSNFKNITTLHEHQTDTMRRLHETFTRAIRIHDKTFKYDRLPVPITEPVRLHDIVLRKQNGDIVKKTTYMTYGNTFADVLEQLEGTCVVRWRFLQTHTHKQKPMQYIEHREIRRTISNIALRMDVVGLYDLDTAVDPMSQTMGMNQSRDKFLLKKYEGR